MYRIFKPLSFAISALSFLPALCSAAPPLLKLSLTAGGWSSSIFEQPSTSSGVLSRSKAAAVSSNGRSGRGECAASATFGVLRTFGDTQITATTGGGLNYAWASASFRDNRVTDAPGRTGQHAFVTIRYTITGSTTLAAPPAADFQTAQSECEAYNDIRVNDNYVVINRQKRSADGNPTCGDQGCANYLNVEQTATYSVTLGTPYDFEMIIASRPTLYSYPNFQGRATADLGHTMTWGGIVSVKDANGNLINDYTDTSASGTNYTAPIVPQCAAPSGALAVWWPGDNHARDIQGGNKGVLENGATYASGQVGQAFSFNAAGARVRVPQAAAIDFNAAQDYTIDFWMKAGPQVTSAATLVEKNGGTYPYSVKLLPTGLVTAGFSDGASPTSVTSTGSAGKLDDNTWHHVAAVFKHSAKIIELYVDGSLNASQTYTATLSTLANGQDLYFGARSDSSNPYVGLLDEVDISNTALSLSEIQAIVGAASLGKCRPAVALSNAVSRKTHGAAGTFDVNLPLTGTPGIECRAGGANGDYLILATFAGPVTASGTPQAEVVTGSGTIGSGGASNGGAVSVSGNTVSIPLTNVLNAQTITLRLNSVDNGATTADVNVPISFLLGDVSGDGFVNSGDATITRNRSGQGTDATNFRTDYNLDGFLNSADATIVRSRSGTALPAADGAELKLRSR